MKKYTQAEFDAIPVDENGIKRCPTGDYTAINRFGGDCRFGEGCICEFGQFVSMLSVGGFGSCGRTTYFFRLSDGRICVRCGCFAGTLDE